MRGRREAASAAFWQKSGKSREREGRALAFFELCLVLQSATAIFVRQLLGPHLRTCP